MFVTILWQDVYKIAITPDDREHQMTLKFYMDENIQRTVATQLQDKGVEVLRCQDAGLRSASDADHLAFATAQGRTIVTGDEDFLILDAEYRTAGKQHAGIVYISPAKRLALGVIIDYLLFLHDAAAGDAIDFETEIFNTVLHV